MKKLIGFLVVLGILFSAPVLAADIVVSVTIPDAYVSRLTDMVTSRWMSSSECNGLTVKQCFIKQMIIDSIKQELYIYELRKARAEAISTVVVDQIEVEGQ